MQRAAATAPDWSSGTRIGDALKEFNDRYGRRGMARGAVVVILSDGWERGDPALVGREMERLARLAHKIVWVNPRVSARGFSVGAAGMRAALEHCDALSAATASRRSARSSRRSRRRRARARCPRDVRRNGAVRGRGGAVAERHPGTRAARSRCRAATGRAAARRRRDGSAGDDRDQALHLPGMRATGRASASPRRPAARLLRPGGAQCAQRPPGAPAPASPRPTTTTTRRIDDG